MHFALLHCNDIIRWSLVSVSSCLPLLFLLHSREIQHGCYALSLSTWWWTSSSIMKIMLVIICDDGHHLWGPPSYMMVIILSVEKYWTCGNNRFIQRCAFPLMKTKMINYHEKNCKLFLGGVLFNGCDSISPNNSFIPLLKSLLIFDFIEVQSILKLKSLLVCKWSVFAFGWLPRRYDSHSCSHHNLQNHC